jgi:hypothetical protein
MSSIIVAGDVSGSVSLTAPSAAGSTVITLPSTSGTMITTASSGQSIPKAALPTGSVLQVVSTQVVSRSFSSSSSSFIDITGLTASITPISSTSKILVSGIVSCGLSVSTEIVYLAIARNGTIVGSGNEANIVSETRSIDRAYAFPIQYLDSPASTSAQTYTFQMKTSGAFTFYLNRRASTDLYNGASVITLMEIAA